MLLSSLASHTGTLHGSTGSLLQRCSYHNAGVAVRYRQDGDCSRGRAAVLK